MIDLTKFYDSDLGINVDFLYEQVVKHKNAIFVDLGVREGLSSQILLIESDTNKNEVYGVDVDFTMLNSTLNNHPNYYKILGDSVTIGKIWDKKIKGLFIDTFHIKEQVLCELYYWYKHLEDDGFIAFHDTNWPESKNDIYGGETWDRVEDAIKIFFNVDKLNYEDEFIRIRNYPESWGMTIVEIKNKKNYYNENINWKEIMNRRNFLISIFWNKDNIGDLKIDLNIDV